MPLRRNGRRSSPRAVRRAVRDAVREAVHRPRRGSAAPGRGRRPRCRSGRSPRSAGRARRRRPGRGWACPGDSSSIYITWASGPASISVRSMSWRALRSFCAGRAGGARRSRGSPAAGARREPRPADGRVGAVVGGWSPVSAGTSSIFASSASPTKSKRASAVFVLSHESPPSQPAHVRREVRHLAHRLEQLDRPGVRDAAPERAHRADGEDRRRLDHVGSFGEAKSERVAEDLRSTGLSLFPLPVYVFTRSRASASAARRR